MVPPRGQRILIADDQPQILSTFGEILRRDGYRVTTGGDGVEALGILENEPVDLVIADLHMPQMDGLELTERVTAEWPDLPVVILTGHASIESAVQAMKMGASDYLTKPIDADELTIKIAKHLEIRRLRKENQRLLVASENRYGEIIGKSRRMREIFEVIDRVGSRPSSVLITGESGTGKELIARAIHERWLDAARERDGAEGEFDPLDYPYIAVNCGALSRTLLESQLFGHKKGTFSGAISDQEGVFVAARQGTLFLDEISELDFDLQVKLLRALQEREVTPLGSTRPVPVHARIITATNKDVMELVRGGEFRADLYYRINVVSIEVPPVRDREHDIPLLVEYYLRITAARYGVAPKEVTPEVMAVFLEYDWPGNVREMQNVIERVFALGGDDRRVRLDDLPRDLVRGDEPRPLEADPSAGPARRRFASFDEVVRAHLVMALDISNGVKSRAAELLGIERNRLYRLMRRYEIPIRPESTHPTES